MVYANGLETHRTARCQRRDLNPQRPRRRLPPTPCYDQSRRSRGLKLACRTACAPMILRTTYREASCPLDAVPELTQDRFVPRGGTALYDAQGKTIVALGEELAAMPESERPSKVIIMTLTDGMENSSKEYTLAMISTLIKEQREKYNWDFVFLGANQDAVKTAGTMNIPMGSAITYSANPAAMRASMNIASNYVKTSRLQGSAMFSKSDRLAAMIPDEDQDSAGLGGNAQWGGLAGSIPGESFEESLKKLQQKAALSSR